MTELSRISMGIIKIVDSQYSEYLDKECLDLIQIKNICNLYKKKSSDSNQSVNLSEIIFTSPEFKKTQSKSKNDKDILKCKEFKKKYSFFIRVLHACLKIEIDIFSLSNKTLTLKNNYQLIKSLENKKKQLFSDHMEVLKLQYKNINQSINESYEKYCHVYLSKLKIIDKITGYIKKLIKNNVFEKTDNLLTLILPYFYTYIEFIEEYNLD